MTATCCLPEALVNSAFHEAVSVRMSFLMSDIPSLSTFLTCPVRRASCSTWMINLFIFQQETFDQPHSGTRHSS